MLSALFGATVPPISKIALEVVSPIGALFIRALLSTVLFLIIFLLIRKPYSFSTLKKTWGFSLLLVFNFICMLVALKYIPTTLIPVVYATIPFITLLINKILKTGDIITRQRILGIAIGFLGVFVATVSRGIASVNTGVIFGVMCILAGSVTFSLYTVLSKGHQQKTHPLHLIFTTTLMATIIMLPFTLIDYVSHPYIQNITWIHITALIATAVIGTVLFYSVYQYTIKHTDSVTVSLFTYLQPIFAIILSIVLLSESVNLIFIIGTATTLVGAYLASNK